MNDLMVAQKDITGAVASMVGKEVNITKAIELIDIKNETIQEAAILLKQQNQKFIILVHETFDDICKDADKLHKDAVAKRKINLKPFEDNKATIEQKLTAYMMAERRKREEEERKRQAKLRKEEEDRRKKAEAARLREAEKLEKAGDDEGAQMALLQAEEVMEQPIVVPTVDVSKSMKKSGVQMRTIWKHRVIDPKKVNREFLMLDMVKINKTVTALRERAAAVIGGIEVYPETKAI